MDWQIEAMQIEDYPALHAFWAATPGVGLSQADSHEGIAQYLARNPGTSFVVRQAGEIVGSVLGGHDGRRGFLHHLAVAPACRQQGLGRALVDAALAGLREQGIQKCHLMVFADNLPGQAFWRRIGWQLREDLRLMSADI